MLLLQTLLPAKPAERLDALFSSQFRSLGKEQWQCLLAFTLLDSVAESSVTLADASIQGCSLAYPLNRKGEYEVVVGQDGQAEKSEYEVVVGQDGQAEKSEYEVGVGQNWQVEKGVLDFVTKTNAILAEFQSVSPAALLRLLEDVVFVDEAVVEKWGVSRMANA